MGRRAISRALAGHLVIALSLVLGSCDPKAITADLEPEPTGPPVIALSAASADFAALVHALAPMQMIAISNAGPGTLGGLGIDSVQYLDDGSGWLTASLAGTTAPVTLALQAAAGNLAPGTYYAAVKLSATGAANSPRSMAVTLRVDPVAVGPIIGLTATAAAFSAVAGGTAPAQVVQILPASDAPLSGLAITDVTYDPSASGWLTATLDRTTAPANLTLTPDPQGLALGTYTAVVAIAAPGAINSPRTIRVTLAVTQAPQAAALRLSTTAVSFSGSTASPPAALSIAITNGGGGSLTGLAVGQVSYGAGTTGWLAAALSTTTAPAMLTLTPTLIGLLPGNYTASVPVSAAGAAASPQSVTITLVVAPGATPAVLALSPASAAFAGQAGAAPPAAKTIAISNTGGGALGSLSTGPIAYGAGANGWLQASLTSTAAPGTLTLTVSTAGLAAGNYSATLPVSSPDASNGPQSVAVTLAVSAGPLPPTIALSTGSALFSATIGGSVPAPKTVTISNSGGGTLSGLGAGPVSYGAGATGWLGAALGGTTAPATLTLTPSLTGLAAGAYTATVPVSAAGAGNSPQSVAVSFTVSAAGSPPAIALAPSSLSFAATAGGASPAAKTASVSKVGGGTLTGLVVGAISYGAGASGWCAAALSVTTAPSTLTVTATLGGLAAGTYSATIPVTAPGASNTPQNVSVTFTVSAAPAPAISLSPTTLTFAATAGGTSPAAKTVAVTNSGGGSLTGLTVGTLTYGAGATGWAATTLNSTTAPATLTVTPTLGSITAGTYTATIPVSAAGATNSPRTVSVTFTVSPATGTVSFATDIYPTFQANCLSSGCHVPGQQKPALNTVSAAYTNLVTATTKYVTPGNPNTGLLLGTLQGTTGKQMPPSGSLGTTFINKVKAWIQQGAPNN